MSESTIQHDILKAWGAHPRLRIWRQNTGVGWFAGGAPARKTDFGAYAVRFGLPGQADLSGIIAPTGVRLEIECKTAVGRQSDEQRTFQRVIEAMGGIYVLARCVEDVDHALAKLGVRR